MLPGSWHTTVVVPTYNESANLPTLIHRVMTTTSFSVLVVDDESPDGTGRIAEELSNQYAGRMQVLHRSPPRGLGRAYKDGMLCALALGAELICQMDADLSHDPDALLDLTASTADADVVVGSRYVAGGSVRNWPLHRLALSIVANNYVRLFTGLRVRDVTSGFKCWRRRALLAVMDASPRSEGYALQFEMLFHAARHHQRIVETPITFIERRQGASKMSVRVIKESAIQAFRLFRSRWWGTASQNGSASQVTLR